MDYALLFLKLVSYVTIILSYEATYILDQSSIKPTFFGILFGDLIVIFFWMILNCTLTVIPGSCYGFYILMCNGNSEYKLCQKHYSERYWSLYINILLVLYDTGTMNSPV